MRKGHNWCVWVRLLFVVVVVVVDLTVRLFVRAFFVVAVVICQKWDTDKTYLNVIKRDKRADDFLLAYIYMYMHPFDTQTKRYFTALLN